MRVDPKYTDFVNIIRKLKVRLTSPIYVTYIKYCSGVDLGMGAKFAGFPTILVRGGSKVVIGSNFSASSKSYINPAGLPHEVIISALGENAVVEIGNNVGLSGTSINCRTGIKIGDNVLVGVGSAIWDTDFHPSDPKLRLTDINAAKTSAIVIENNVFIGARAVVLKGVTIGEGSVVAAGTIVNRDIPKNHVAYGNPMITKERR